MEKLLNEIMDMVADIDESLNDDDCDSTQEKIDVLWAVLQSETRTAYLNSLLEFQGQKFFEFFCFFC